MSNLIFLCKNELNDYGKTGNWTTVSRIKGHVEIAGYKCSIVKTNDISQDYWAKNEVVKGVLAIHALHCFESLQNCPYSIILIFGGTDLNEYAKNKSYFERMTTVVEKARFVITFGPTMTLKAQELWPNLISERLKQIPQAVEKMNPSYFNLVNYLQTTKSVMANKIFLLVAGIRPIKDPLYLVKEFETWHYENQNSYLVIIGNNRHKEFFKTVSNRINKLKGIFLIPEMPREDILACMTCSFALVNSSLSEGMSGAILEAMSLNLPVIARDISGNRDLIKHGVTGLLYKTPQEFLTQIQLLMKDTTLLNFIKKNAKFQVEMKHSLKSEAKAYQEILSLL